MSLFTYILRWKKRRSERFIVMYTRPGCHLCEEAWELLKRFQTRYGFQLDAKDVDSNPALADLHGDWVPVVTIDGKVRFRGQINEVLLKRLLECD
jgi:glutaredoxin